MLLLRACLSGAAVASLEPVWETDVHTPHELGRPLLQLLERGASSDGEQQRPPPHPPRPPVPPDAAAPCVARTPIRRTTVQPLCTTNRLDTPAYVLQRFGNLRRPVTWTERLSSTAHITSSAAATSTT
jgi:hypothetical protein